MDAHSGNLPIPAGAAQEPQPTHNVSSSGKTLPYPCPSLRSSPIPLWAQRSGAQGGSWRPCTQRHKAQVTCKYTFLRHTKAAIWLLLPLFVPKHSVNTGLSTIILLWDNTEETSASLQVIPN